MGKGLKIILNIAVFLLVAGFITYMAISVNEEKPPGQVVAPVTGTFVSPYKRIASFDLPDEVNRMDLYDGKLFVSAGQSVYIVDEGRILADFQVKPDVRDIAVTGGGIYILYPAGIEVYSLQGEPVRQWEACSDLSDYCSLAVTGNHVFVTDAENKNICKYTTDGNFAGFINSPRDFIIPSYAFDIEAWNDTIYCVNAGRHLVETYTLDGDFIAAFGGPGGEAGFFAGCCNPVYISFTPKGDLLTSEKGNPRISRFARNGKFMEVLLNSKLLGGGNKAYAIQAFEDILFVANKNSITVFQYDDQ